jgi:hypothetical protein
MPNDDCRNQGIEIFRRLRDGCDAFDLGAA